MVALRSQPSKAQQDDGLGAYLKLNPFLHVVHRRTQKNRLATAILCAVVAGLVLVAISFGWTSVSERKTNTGRGPVVDLGYSRYRGTYLRNGVSEFLGMRFAHPPLGDLRWRAPIKPNYHIGVKDAKKMRPVCMGVDYDADHPDRDGNKMSEDCLFVNIWAPTDATSRSNLPVMVFVQGGGYTRNANANWNGSMLVETSEQNIVFVNFNYRVGLFGFLAGKEVKDDGDLNVGLLDQRLLLQWVQENISAFGGNPNHVILQGVSAGAGAVALQMVAYGGRNDGLFHGVIAESVFFPALQYLKDQEYQLQRIIDQAGCAGSANHLSCLRGKPLRELQKLNGAGPFPGRMVPPLFYWTPSIDGDLLPELPSNMYESRKIINVPLLMGTCTDEGTGFAPNASLPDHLVSFFQDNYPNLSEQQAIAIPDHYPLQDEQMPMRDVWFPSAARAYGEATFVCPTNSILNSLNSLNSASASKPKPIWSYRFNVRDDIYVSLGLGVPHVLETTAVMGGPGMLPDTASSASFSTYNAPMVPVVMKYWLSFVRSLDPNVHKDADAPVWEPWGSSQRRLLLQTGGSVMETVDQGQSDRCRFWQSLASSMNQR